MGNRQAYGEPAKGTSNGRKAGWHVNVRSPVQVENVHVDPPTKVLLAIDTTHVTKDQQTMLCNMIRAYAALPEATPESVASLGAIVSAIVQQHLVVPAWPSIPYGIFADAPKSTAPNTLFCAVNFLSKQALSLFCSHLQSAEISNYLPSQTGKPAVLCTVIVDDQFPVPFPRTLCVLKQ